LLALILNSIQSIQQELKLLLYVIEASLNTMELTKLWINCASIFQGSYMD